MILTKSTTDQLMATAAFRYCLGRQSYIVGTCIEWIKDIWTQLDSNSQFVILRDTIEALQRDKAGADIDKVGWHGLAKWMWAKIEPDIDRNYMLHQHLAHREIVDITTWLNDYQPRSSK
jgi:hypothetical protein